VLIRFIDIYSHHNQRIEVFPKTDFNDTGKEIGGIAWEEDPIKHREVAKKIAPAFSNRAIKAMEPVIHQYFDYFVERMKLYGASDRGYELVQWTSWLAMDLSADLTSNEKMHNMKRSKLSVYAFHKFLVYVYL